MTISLLRDFTGFKSIITVSLLFTTILTIGCATAQRAPNEIESNLSKIQLPPGFSISLYASDLKNARSMAIAPDGTIFVGTRTEGSVYAIKDTDKDGLADKKWVLSKSLNMPNGVAFKDGTLYVAEVDKIWAYDNILSQLEKPAKSRLVYDKYPSDKHHGWKYIAFGPDGRLYVPVGAPCNVCLEKDSIYATLTSIDVKNPSAGPRIEAHGIRNTVGFAWQPKTEALFFTDNGRDMLGDDIPACELNMLTRRGERFGFPYIHADQTIDPEYGSKKPAGFKHTRPVQELGAHVAPLGIKFMPSSWPRPYGGQPLIAEHGSWNRSTPIGYRLSTTDLFDYPKAEAGRYSIFAEGWLGTNGEAWGRPVDILVLPDESVLVSDDLAGAIYRITYKE